MFNGHVLSDYCDDSSSYHASVFIVLVTKNKRRQNVHYQSEDEFEIIGYCMGKNMRVVIDR